MYRVWTVHSNLWSHCIMVAFFTVHVWMDIGVSAYVCVHRCVFAALFLLSIHLQQRHPSICRLPNPPYHLSSSFVHSSHPSLLSHTYLSLSLSHQAPLSYFIPVTDSLSHVRHYRTMLPLQDRKTCRLTKFVVQEWRKTMVLFFMLVLIQSGERKNPKLQS